MPVVIFYLFIGLKDNSVPPLEQAAPPHLRKIISNRRRYRPKKGHRSDKATLAVSYTRFLSFAD
jgi:hypothetical protein